MDKHIEQCVRRLLVLGVLVFTFVAHSSAFAASPAHPNIVLILADDLGWADLGCYNADSKIPTPNLDRLAAEGVRLTDAHSPSSVCSPTRYGILTGRYCWRTPLKKSVLWRWDPPLIESDRLTLPAFLKAHGYHTACIGKWHLGWTWPTADGSPMEVPIAIGQMRKDRSALGKQVDFTRPTTGGPTDRGFDYYFGDDVPNFPPYCFIENDRTVGLPSVTKQKNHFGHSGPSLPGWDLSMVMPTLTQKAAAYIERRADQARDGDREPFFLYFPLTAPHTPIAPTPHFIGKSKAGWYGDYVHQIDWTVGQILKTLERRGLKENTLVLFTSDNGSPCRDGTNMSGPTGSVRKLDHNPSGPWRGMKADIHEAGHRVPFLARWPGHTSGGSTSAETVCLTDLFASISTILNARLPDNVAEDSYDVSAAILGRTIDQPIREAIVHHSSDGMFAIRQGDWKLILGRGSGGFTAPRRIQPKPGEPIGQLYHLTEDPHERQNVYAAHPEIVSRLTALLKQYQRSGRSR